MQQWQQLYQYLVGSVKMISILTLFLLTGIMFILSFSVSLVPILFVVSEKPVRVLSAIGKGLLIGCSLAVIIPEGIEILQSALKEQKSGAHLNLQQYFAICILFGFILMYIVEASQDFTCEDEEMYVEGRPSSLAYTSTSNENYHTAGAKLGDRVVSFFGKALRERSIMVGLLVHAMADGLALATSLTSDSFSVTAVVYLAILIHKSPVALGLCTILLQRVGDRASVISSMLLFCAATPLTTIIFWLIIQGVMSTSIVTSRGDLDFYSGLILLFSGGTFLYVASSHHEKTSGSILQLYATLIGMLIPLPFIFFSHDV